MEETKLISAIESLLFMSGEPLSFARLGKTLGAKKDEIGSAVTKLKEKYASDPLSGLMLTESHDEVVLVTAAKNASFVEALTKSTLQEHLSKAALEVLSIVAYRAPITRAEIDAVRGVNCSFTLRNLLLRDLIERAGNPADARGYIYRPSLRFLQTLGVSSAQELPDYAALSEDERLKMIFDGEDALLSQDEAAEETKNKQ